MGSGGVEPGAGTGPAGLDVVHRLARGDLGQSLAGAPQLPRDLARTHLRRVEEEGREGGRRWWRKRWGVEQGWGGKKSVKSKETKEEEEEEGSRRDNDS